MAFAIILLISTIQWIVDGRKNYKGPTVDTEALEHAMVVGLDGEIAGSTENEIDDNSKAAEQVVE